MEYAPRPGARDPACTGMPKPTAATSSVDRAATPRRRPRRSSPIRRRLIESERASAGRGVRTARSGSTTPARSLVPPRSTPMTQPVGVLAADMGAATIPTADGGRETPVQGLPQPPPAAPAARRGRRAGGLRARRARRRPRQRRSGRAAARPATLPQPPGAPKPPPPKPGRRRKPITAWRVAALGRSARSSAGSSSPRPLPDLRADPARRPRGRRSAASSATARYPLTGANTILVLGSDARAGDQERRPAAAARAARTRSCCCASAAAPTPRSRSRATRWSTSPATASNKINAAYAFGGPALAIQTVKQLPRHRRSTTSSRSTSRTSPS